MFVFSKRNIILPGPNGEKFRMPKDYMGAVPAWAEDSTYLKALMADGKVVLSESGTDKDFAANEGKKGGKKGGRSLISLPNRPPPPRSPIRTRARPPMYPASKPQFFGVRAAAANLSGEPGNYTSDMFQEDFPQFYSEAMICLVPPAMLEEFIRTANAAITPDKWLDGWRYACGLYVAHQAALYLRTYAESSETPAQAAATGSLIGVVKSATLGDSSVSYDTDALTKATADWGDLNATQYGQLLATRARLVGMGGTYVI